MSVSVKDVKDKIEAQTVPIRKLMDVVEEIPDNMIRVYHLKGIYSSIKSCNKTILVSRITIKQAIVVFSVEGFNIEEKADEINEALDETFGALLLRLEALKNRQLTVLRKSRNPMIRFQIFMLNLLNN